MFRKKSGFTLIELMIVVVIIGILAALAIVRFQEASKKAKYSHAHIWLKHIYEAVEQFYYDNGCYPPDAMWNVAPSGLCPTYLDKWPTDDIDPFGTYFDYENHNVGGSQCVWVSYFGKDKTHNGRWSPSADPGGVGAIIEISGSDDLIIVIGKDCVTCP